MAYSGCASTNSQKVVDVIDSCKIFQVRPVAFSSVAPHCLWQKKIWSNYLIKRRCNLWLRSLLIASSFTELPVLTSKHELTISTCRGFQIRIEWLFQDFVNLEPELNLWTIFFKFQTSPAHHTLKSSFSHC